MATANHANNYASEWATQLGLLPVPLFANDTGYRSILLNGLSGNFCLDATSGPREDNRAKAWSANVGHYVTVTANQVEVQRWSNTISEREQYPLSSVSHDLERFHTYLVRREPPWQRAVVPHVVRVFRQIRNREELATGASSLKVLLLLLASAAGGTNRSRVDTSSWALPQDARSLANSISDAEWEQLMEMLLHPVDSDLQLNLDLLIRHAAGPVFQEAHREATLVDSSQLPLPGFPRRAVEIGRLEVGVGVHFTPPPLARTVVEQALLASGPCHEFTIFDPACGSGEFLREALRQIRLSDPQARIHLIGWDTSATACDMARFLLFWEQRKDTGSLEFEISQHDSLKEQWPSETSLLLMNPPFVSYEQLTSEQKDSVRTVMGRLARGRMEYSNAFIYKALDSLRHGAVIGTIIPSSFYESSAAAELRNWAKERLSPWLLARLGSQVLFPDAIVDAGLLIGTINGGMTDDLLAFWADERAESTAEGLRYLRKATRASRPRSSVVLEREGFSIFPAKELVQDSRSWSPRRYSAWRLARDLQSTPRAGELFAIRTGARSGLLKAYLLRKNAWLKLPKKEQKFFRPAVVNESIESGQLRDVVYVFYPHGEFDIKSERALRSELPDFYKTHLQRYRASLEARDSGAAKGAWWEMHRPRSWQEGRLPKLVSVQYGNVGAFGWDATGDFVVVGGYAWLPRSPLKPGGKLTLKLGLAYLALLNSPLFFELVASTSRKVRGGQWDLGNKYLERVPLPNLLSAEGSPVLDSLFRVGSDIHSGNPVDWEALGKLAETVYGF